MKNYFLSGFLLICLSGCNALDELTKFDMDYNTEVVIESSFGVNLPFNVFTPEIESNSESEFAINDTRKDLIEEIQLKELSLRITAPQEEDFSFLESVEIFITAEGLEEVLIASMTDVPQDIGDLLELDTSNADIQEYIKKDRFQLRLNTVTDEAIAVDHYIDVNAIFFVDAKILGI
ncbi:MAG: hypothetical protein KJO04_08290 [Bacteroidia bacterium]|nr:hypothetical protein [Bacteroidia bacterium]